MNVKKIITQFVKFSIVGGICFILDYIIGLAILNTIVLLIGKVYFTTASIIGSAGGFIVSVVVNYILSFKFVFERKENLNKKTEFIIFVLLSIIGLLINSVIIWLVVGPIYHKSFPLLKKLNYNLVYTAAKILATAIVMVYNFITRKVFLEQAKPDLGEYSKR